MVALVRILRFIRRSLRYLMEYEDVYLRNGLSFFIDIADDIGPLLRLTRTALSAIREGALDLRVL